MAKKKLTKKKLEEFALYFLQEKQKILKSLLEKKEEPDVDGDEIDLVQGNLLNSMIEALSNRDQIRLNNIEIALKKIEDNTFGDCEACDEQISEPRLAARPEATLCISCAEELEKNSHNFIS